MTPTCAVCKRRTADTAGRIFLDKRLTGYYVVLLKYTLTSLNFPVCVPCNSKVRLDNSFNKNGAGLIVAGLGAIGVGLLAIYSDIDLILAGNFSALFQMPAIGMAFIAPAIWIIWRSFKARQNIRGYLESLGYKA